MTGMQGGSTLALSDRRVAAVPARPPRVALVHDWLTGMRGGERCLEVFCELFPDAPLYTLLHVPGQREPRHRAPAHRHLVRAAAAGGGHAAIAGTCRCFPPRCGASICASYDLVVSLSHCVAKAVRVRPGALHLCYCFTPMRYVWDLEDGLRRGRRPAHPARCCRRWRRPCGAGTARTDGVGEFVAISSHIADRIRRAYDRDAEVIHPPVDCARFRPAASADDYYLVVSALVPYKRVDLAILAANRLGRRLLVVGQGPESRRLRALAGPDVTFLGWRDDAEVAELYARCRAVLFPAVEDYGIVPLEAAAAGRPTIALGRGGVLETMVGLDAGDEPPTAVFFGEQTVDARGGGHRRVREGGGALRSRRRCRRGRPVSTARSSRDGCRSTSSSRWRAFQAAAAC